MPWTSLQGGREYDWSIQEKHSTQNEGDSEEMRNHAVTGKSSVTIAISQDTWLAHVHSRVGNISQGNTPRRKVTTPSVTGARYPPIVESDKGRRHSNTTTAPRPLKESSRRALSMTE